MTAEPMHIRQRRSGRIFRQLPIQVTGSDIRGRGFIVNTRTVVLSRFGAKIVLPCDLASDQEITICYPATGKDAGARVVALFSKLPDGYTYGIEFLFSDGNFWNITFPVVPGSTAGEGSANLTPGQHQTAPQDTAIPVPAAASGEQSELSPAPRLRNYAVRLLCTEGGEQEWIFLQDREEPLKRILETPWEFVCPIHGAQCSLPLEATETVLAGRPVARGRRQSAATKPGAAATQKSVRRQEQRRAQKLRVWVRGIDLNGHPFVQSAYSINISKRGGRLSGLGQLVLPGTVIEVQRRFKTALYRVVWVGQIGTPQSDQIGITALQPDRTLWNVP